MNHQERDRGAGRPSCLLAEVPMFGSVYDCGECGNVHVSVGPVNLTLTPDAYLQFVVMIQTSAASFEAWLDGRPSSSARVGEDAA